MDESRDELERLRASEARLRAALDARGVGVWEWWPRTGETFWDARTRELWGLDPHVAPAFSLFLAGIHPEDRERVREAVTRAMQPDAGGAYEIELRVVDPSTRWISARGVCSFDAEGRPERFTGTVVDVTKERLLRDRAQARARRQEANARLVRRLARAATPEASLAALCEEIAGALSASIVTVRVIDQATGLTSTAHDFGAPPGWAPPAAAPEHRERFLAEHGDVAQFPDLRLVPDLPSGDFLRGHGVESLAHARLVLDERTAGLLISMWKEPRTLDAEEMQFFVAAADVAAAGLVSARVAARYREIVHAMSECVVLTDSIGRIVFVNPAVETFLGYATGELVGDTGHRLWFEEDRAAREARYGELVAGAPPRRELLRYRTRDGREVWGLEAMVRFRDTSIRSGALTIVTDVTESRRVDAAVRQAQRLESLGVLAGGIAHDFNNLLVGILGNASMALEDAAGQPELVRCLADIETAAERAAELTRQLLAYAGKGRFVLARSSVNELVEGIARLVSATISKRILLRYELSSDVLVVEGDATQLRQVIMNLLTNAADAIGTQSGVVTLRTRACRLDAEALSQLTLGDTLTAGEYVAIEVIDTGSGMSEQTRARIFDPFFTTKFTGRGLGLAAVLGILRAHHAAIDVESIEGQGTTFRVLLPRVGVDSAVATAPPAVERHSLLPKCTVLVVDDEDDVRRVMCRVLTRRGVEVIEANDGPSAVDAFRAHRGEIDVVVLDYTMPGMSGAEVLTRLQAIDPDVRVVLASGYSEGDVTRLFEAGGIRGFVSKPFTAETLVERVLAALSPAS
ncbi:MAG: PAS domain S-box protein [Deltaproteobacteria bacterium]|nr:PAS domain S-box protein [Deltaproteobacteria bacterium]